MRNVSGGNFNWVSICQHSKHDALYANVYHHYLNFINLQIITGVYYKIHRINTQTKRQKLVIKLNWIELKEKKIICLFIITIQGDKVTHYIPCANFSRQ